MTHEDGSEEGEPTVGSLLQARLEQQAARLREQEDRVREGADSAIHKMRIAVRRLRSALATYRPVLAPGATDSLREELRWLGLELSPARDAQVMSERLEALVDEQPVELVMGPVRKRIHMEMAGRYQAGRRQALESLDDARYAELLVALDAFVAEPPFEPSANRPARTEVPRLLQRDLDRVRRRAEVATTADDPVTRDLALHDTRKAAKRLRYAAESATDVFGGRAKRLARRSMAIQELLGEHQDAVVSRRTLRELGAKAYLEHENGFTFGRLHALEEAHAEQLVSRYPAALGRLPKRPLKRWLRT